MSTDAEMSDAIGAWNIQSPADSCQVLDEGIAHQIVQISRIAAKPTALLNLQAHAEKQRGLDKLRSSDGRSRKTYSDAWRDTATYEEQKRALE